MRLPGEEAREVRALLKFDEHSAGGMMTTDFVYVGETATRAEVVEWVRGARTINVEQLDTIFVIDGDAKFSGEVAVGRLLLAPERRTAGAAQVRTAGFGAARREREGSLRACSISTICAPWPWWMRRAADRSDHRG